MDATAMNVIPGTMTPAEMAAVPLEPQRGDVVVRSCATHWRVGLFGGPDQLSEPSRARALGVARGFAAEARVNVWASEEIGYRLLEIYRCR